MPLLVMKFGGTSVSGLDRIENAAKNLSRVVVTSFLIVVGLCSLYQLGLYGVLGMSLSGKR